jgi:hypothetical protein
MFNLPALRNAAIQVTRIVTGADPHPKTEVYGSRALDVCFDPAAMGGMGGASIDGVNLFEVLGVEERIRISSMTTPHMVSFAGLAISAQVIHSSLLTSFDPHAFNDSFRSG